jgi:hypothetical protein
MCLVVDVLGDTGISATQDIDLCWNPDNAKVNREEMKGDEEKARNKEGEKKGG